MRYSDLRYVPEAEDPSLRIETRDLVIMVIDNSGLLCEFVAPHEGAYIGPKHHMVPISHHLGYHGVRTLYDKRERRNIVAPFVSWLNLQGFSLTKPDGNEIAVDPIDERARRGVGRGWPMTIDRDGKGVRLRIGPAAQSGLQYTITIHPHEPDGIDVRFEFLLTKGPGCNPTLTGTWPCYMSTLFEVALAYPQGPRNDLLDGASPWTWASMGERRNWILGETVGFDWSQEGFFPEQAAAPMAYGRIGSRTLLFSFDDDGVVPYVANGGGHFQSSSVENPAWDFRRTWESVQVGIPVSFGGRVEYFEFRGEDDVAERYRTFRRRIE